MGQPSVGQVHVPGQTRILRNLRYRRIDLVDSGASQDPLSGEGAHIRLYKRAEPVTPVDKATWDAAYLDSLPDSSFAAIVGDKRSLPYKDKDGKVDLPHLRNALARLDQTDLPDAAKASARRKLEAAAKENGVGDAAEKRSGDRFWDSFIAKIQDGNSKLADAITQVVTGRLKKALDEEIAKDDGAMTFADAQMLQGKGELLEDFYDDLSALCQVICSILDGTGSDKAALVQQAITDYCADMQEDVTEWLAAGGDTDEDLGKRAVLVAKVGRKIAGDRMKRLKAMYADLGKLIGEAEGNGNDGTQDDKAQAGPTGSNTSKGATTMADAESTKTQQVTVAVVAPSPTDDVQKRIDEAVAKAAAENADLKKRLDDEVQIRKRGEYIAKVALFKSLPLQADDDYKVFQEMEEKCSPEVAKRLTEILKAADEGMRTAGLFKAHGSDQSGEGNTADTQIRALAAARVSKSAGAETFAQAYAAVLNEQPELYKQHLRESGRQ